MSDPKQQRADGCSVFTSLLLGLLFISSFFIIQKFFEVKKEDTEMEPNKRSESISTFSIESENFINKIDSFYADKNNSLESTMQSTVELYKHKSNKSDK